MLKNINKSTVPSKEALDLKRALEEKGIRVYKELDDGYKHIDLTIPKAKINIEIDGIQHLINSNIII